MRRERALRVGAFGGPADGVQVAASVLVSAYSLLNWVRSCCFESPFSSKAQEAGVQCWNFDRWYCKWPMSRECFCGAAGLRAGFKSREKLFLFVERALCEVLKLGSLPRREIIFRSVLALSGTRFEQNQHSPLDLLQGKSGGRSKFDLRIS